MKIPKMSLSINADEWWVAHLEYFIDLYSRTIEVPGNVVECGLGRGHSFYKLAWLADNDHSSFARELWGFDSFKGFPDPASQDASPRNPKKGEWAINSQQSMLSLLSDGKLLYGSKAIQKSLNSIGIKSGGNVRRDFVNDRVRLVPGYFSESLSGYSGKPISFLHLDVDLYDSYKQTLEYFWPLVSNGGIVAFDEYDRPNTRKMFPGAIKAINEFFGEDRCKIKTVKFSGMPQHSRHFIVKESV